MRELPKNIREKYSRSGDIIGYRVTKQIGGESFSKNFTGENLDICIQKAKNYLSYLNTKAQELNESKKSNTFKLIGEPVKHIIRPFIGNNEKEPACNDVGGSDLEIGMIYKITDATNGKIYVGQTRKYYKGSNGTFKLFGPERRLKKHISEAVNGRGYCTKLANAIRNHGAENFSIETLEEVHISKLNNLETFYISKYNSIQNGYNILLGGHQPLPDSVKEKVSQSIRQKNRDPEYKKNISAGSKNSWKSRRLPIILPDDTLDPNEVLPMYIHFVRNANKNIVGCGVSFKVDGKMYNKSFSTSSLTMKQKLDLAIQWRNENDPRKNLYDDLVIC